jgi:hypothetical protein
MAAMRVFLLVLAFSCFLVVVASSASVNVRIVVGIIGAAAYIWREHGTEARGKNDDDHSD